MGSFGHSTLKPTLTFGTAFGAKNWCNVNSSVHPSNWQSCMACWLPLSPWAYRLKHKLTQSVRKRVKKNQQKNKALARKYVDKNGQKRVCQTYWFCNSWHQVPLTTLTIVDGGNSAPPTMVKTLSIISKPSMPCAGFPPSTILVVWILTSCAISHLGVESLLNFVLRRSTHLDMGRLFADTIANG